MTALAIATSSARGQDAPRGEGATKAEAPVLRLDDLKQAAEQYRIVVDSEPPRRPVLKPEPLLRWNNPLRGTVAGAVFVWIADGRPEVVASLYRYTANGAPVEDHEFQSLAMTGLSATLNGGLVWAPSTAGIALAPIPGAPAPAASPGERLRQMRALAREFHAFFNGAKDKSELRLLPQPLYRYEPSRADLVDGALFGFVQSTDPEVLLVIEARKTGTTTAWHYGLARMSMVDLRAEHKGREVWQVPWDYQVSAPNKPYMTRSTTPRTP
jgi:hypothetical protein